MASIVDGMTPLAPAARQLLDAQYGRATRSQLRGLGYSDRQLAALRTSGVFTVDARGLWTAIGAPRTFRAQVMAAVLAAGPGACAARASAAALHGLRESAPDTIDVLVPAHRTPAPALPGVRIRRSRTITATQVVDVDGIPTTSAVRTVVDLAITHSATRLRDLLARGLRLGLFDLADVSAQLRRSGRINGAPRLRTALCSLDPDAAAAQSAAEQAAFDALVAAQLGEPSRQHVIEVAGFGPIRTDLAFPEHRIVIEVDGYWWHSTPAQKNADERRQNALVLAGWRVLRFSADDAIHRPHLLVDAVRHALAMA